MFFVVFVAMIARRDDIVVTGSAQVHSTQFFTHKRTDCCVNAGIGKRYVRGVLGGRKRAAVEHGLVAVGHPVMRPGMIWCFYFVTSAPCWYANVGVGKGKGTRWTDYRTKL